MPDTMSLLNSVGVNTSLYQPVFMATQAAGQAVTTVFPGQAITWTTPTIDSYGGWSSGTPTKYIPPTPGWYLCVGGVGYPVNSTGSRIAQLEKNTGSGYPNAFATGTPALPTSSFNLPVQATGLFQMNGTTDFVELWAYQDSGSTLTTVPGYTFMMALRVRLS